MNRLRTRRPTGQVAWPLILVEGEEKTGKSHAAYSLSADPRIGRTFVFDVGEGTADEYAELGPYEVVEHNGTYGDILDQLQAACAQPVDNGLCNAVVIDSATAVWDLLKDWTGSRARNSKAGRRKLEQDPDAEVDVPMNLWNDANDRWNRILNVLRRSNVVGVLIARAKETAKVQGGQPVAGQTEYKVEAQKGLPFAVTAQVRMSRPHTATLVAVRSLHVDVPAKGIQLPEPNPLAHLVFDVMKAGPGSTPAQITHGVVGLSVKEAKDRLLDFLNRENVPDPKIVARTLWDKHAGTDAPEITPDHLVAILDAAAEWVAAQGHEEPPAAPAEEGPAAPGPSSPPLTPQLVAVRAGKVFGPAASKVNDAAKSVVVDRLRHALVWAVTQHRSTSLKDCTAEELSRVWEVLAEIDAGDASFDFGWGDGTGVTFALESGGFTVRWSDFEDQEAAA